MSASLPPDQPPQSAAEPLPESCAMIDVEELTTRAQEASAFLKALAHEGRLMILCHLAGGERSVTELESLLTSRQAAVSQQLARLRLEGLVRTRREGKTIFYSLADPRVEHVMAVVYEQFCGAPKA